MTAGGESHQRRVEVGGELAERAGAAPSDRRRFDERVDEQQHAGGDEYGTRKIEAPPRANGTVSGNEADGADGASTVEDEYIAGLEAAGFEDVSVEFTHQAADGMHGAIVKAAKTREPEKKGLPVIQTAA